jgi:hypothetical protein
MGEIAAGTFLSFRKIKEYRSCLLIEGSKVKDFHVTPL